MMFLRGLAISASCVVTTMPFSTGVCSSRASYLLPSDGTETAQQRPQIVARARFRDIDIRQRSDSKNAGACEP